MGGTPPYKAFSILFLALPLYQLSSTQRKPIASLYQWSLCPGSSWQSCPQPHSCS